jgi:acyl-CoA thioesterase
MAAARTVAHGRLPHSLLGYFLRPGSPDHPVIMWARVLDDWVLPETWSVKAIGAQGLYARSIRDRDGRLGALLSQEILFRRRPDR